MAANRALATRCPACGTVFRVVPDQLRVSDGWVRCGRCAEVFNAPESLVDMDTGARHRLPVAAREPMVEVQGGDTPAPAQTARAPLVDAETAPVPPAATAAPPSQSEGIALRTALQLAAIAPETSAPSPGVPVVASPLDDEARTLPDPRAEPDDRPPPSFVRRAEQAARWRRPRVRLTLGAAACAAGLMFAAQLVFAYRDLAAARWPALQPMLAQACLALHCELGAPRFSQGLAVQSSGLTRVDASDLYRLVVTLRNQADIDLAPPAIDLSLTDAQGQLVSRRVLRLADLGPAPDRLPAGRELVLQATLQVASGAAAQTVAGYTIELFYP